MAASYNMPVRDKALEYHRPNPQKKHSNFENTKACEGCRRRKIKCDSTSTSQWPCATCARLKLLCKPPEKVYEVATDAALSLMDPLDPFESDQDISAQPFSASLVTYSHMEGNLHDEESVETKHDEWHGPKTSSRRDDSFLALQPIPSEGHGLRPYVDSHENLQNEELVGAGDKEWRGLQPSLQHEAPSANLIPYWLDYPESEPFSTLGVRERMLSLNLSGTMPPPSPVRKSRFSVDPENAEAAHAEIEPTERHRTCEERIIAGFHMKPEDSIQSPSTFYATDTYLCAFSKIPCGVRLPEIGDWLNHCTKHLEFQMEGWKPVRRGGFRKPLCPFNRGHCPLCEQPYSFSRSTNDWQSFLTHVAQQHSSAFLDPQIGPCLYSSLLRADIINLNRYNGIALEEGWEPQDHFASGLLSKPSPRSRRGPMSQEMRTRVAEIRKKNMKPLRHDRDANSVDLDRPTPSIDSTTASTTVAGNNVADNATDVSSTHAGPVSKAISGHGSADYEKRVAIASKNVDQTLDKTSAPRFVETPCDANQDSDLISPRPSYEKPEAHDIAADHDSTRIAQRLCPMPNEEPTPVDSVSSPVGRCLANIGLMFASILYPTSVTDTSKSWIAWVNELVQTRDEHVQRLEWTCECGKCLQWDVPNITEEQAGVLSGYLDRASGASNDSHNDRSESRSSSSSSHSDTSSPSQSSIAATSIDESSSSNDDFRNTVDRNANHEQPRSSIRSRYLEMCISNGQYKKQLVELNITDIKSDGELFQAISDSYYKTRQHQIWFLPTRLQQWVQLYSRRWRLKKPTAKEFRKFMVDSNTTIGLCASELPPPCEVSNQRYHYQPCPQANIDEVIPDHIFFHLFNNPAPHYNSKWIHRIPKKLSSSISDSTDQIPIGWGIYIVETANLYVIFLALLMGLLLSGILAVVFAAVAGDVQGAFSIGAYLVAVLTVWMSAMYFKWSQE